MGWNREGVTLVVPTIKPRRKLLARALESAWAQKLPFTDVHVVVDVDKEGAPATRTKGLDAVRTRWTAFLDDDDELYPEHLETLIYFVLEHDADLVYPWYDVAGGADPFPQFEGREWDPTEPHMFPITVLARTELLQATGGFRTYPDGRHEGGEDWQMWLSLLAEGAKFVHCPKRTWKWHHGPHHNTSGRPDKW